MSLWDKIKGEFVDIIEWLDPTNDTLVHRFERYGNEIKNGAKLTVRESQLAVFVSEGQIADIFGPGLHTLNTRNLPILTTIKSWPYGFESPFKAEVYFVNTRNYTDQKWGTKAPIILNDDRFGMLEVRAFGTYAIKVDDPGVFIKEIVGTDGNFTTDEVNEQLRSIVVTQFTDALGESRIPVEGLAGNSIELSEFAQKQIEPEFAAYGLELTKFLVESVSMPEEIKKEIFELSRLDRIDLDKLMKMKTAKAIEKAAENPGGTAGIGAGIGAGMAMADQMAKSMVNNNQHNNPASGPPPLPIQAALFVALNGQQAGPFDNNTIKNMVENGQISGDTLVWKQGMSNWAAANETVGVKEHFGATPPPLPGI